VNNILNLRTSKNVFPDAIRLQIQEPGVWDDHSQQTTFFLQDKGFLDK
jgi:hypothetical protein